MSSQKQSGSKKGESGSHAGQLPSHSTAYGNTSGTSVNSHVPNACGAGMGPGAAGASARARCRGARGVHQCQRSDDKRWAVEKPKKRREKGRRFKFWQVGRGDSRWAVTRACAGRCDDSTDPSSRSDHAPVGATTGASVGSPSSPVGDSVGATTGASVGSPSSPVGDSVGGKTGVAVASGASVGTVAGSAVGESVARAPAASAATSSAHSCGAADRGGAMAAANGGGARRSGAEGGGAGRGGAGRAPTEAARSPRWRVSVAPSPLHALPPWSLAARVPHKFFARAKKSRSAARHHHLPPVAYKFDAALPRKLCGAPLLPRHRPLRSAPRPHAQRPHAASTPRTPRRAKGGPARNRGRRPPKRRCEARAAASGGGAGAARRARAGGAQAERARPRDQEFARGGLGGCRDGVNVDLQLTCARGSQLQGGRRGGRRGGGGGGGGRGGEAPHT